MGGRKHSLNLVESEQGQRPPVFFIPYIDFENNIHIHIHRSLYLENQKIIYTELTLVLTQVCPTWVMHHTNTPTTLPELSSLTQP